ncbi:ABC transporter permease [Haloarculaceae archaeon H-GB2-1]|nr:ABC transporter permease [Haloarculaceae archaeon H-GB1-1]MEA5388974.1 ABC transporter permease [Haloarculaceae archaeon H-GB11]MEA5407032.1 ABC transporter permease [Haloarculaceae archaeon H-GB2-1]
MSSDIEGLTDGRWLVIARKEFADTIRSKVLWILSVLFVSVFALPAALAQYFDIGQFIQSQTGQQVTTNLLAQQTSRLASALVPIIAIAVAYAAITREREKGSLKLLLSLPHTRADVVVGKVVGRSGVVAVPIAVGMLITMAVVLPTQIAFKAGGFVTFALLTMLLGVAFVGLSVGVSAATSTSRRSMVGTVGLFVYFYLFWNSFARGVGQLLKDHAGIATDTQLHVTLFLKLLNPTQAYQTLLTSALGTETYVARARMFSGLMGQIVAQQLKGSLPFYLGDGMALAILLAWLVVPVALGYVVFQAADL